MKQQISILLVSFIVAANTMAQKQFNYYSAAPAGLSLREEPSQKSKRLELIPYGIKLTEILMTHDYPAQFGFDTIDGYIDTWMKIQYNGKQGYVFSAYVLPISPPKKEDNNVEKYLARVFGNPVYVDSFPNSYMDDNSGQYEINYRYLYKQGEVMLVPALMEAEELSILNTDFGMQGAYLWMYLIGKYLYSYPANPEVGYRFPLYNKMNYPLKSSKNDSVEVIISNVNRESIEIQKRTEVHTYLKLFYQGQRISITFGSDIF